MILLALCSCAHLAEPACVCGLSCVCVCETCREQMAAAGVNGVVTADVLTELSNDTVLTTAWIDGECGCEGVAIWLAD